MKDHKDHKDPPELQVQEQLALQDHKDHKGQWVPRDHKDHKGHKVPRVPQVT